MYLHHTQYGKTLAFAKGAVNPSKTHAIELDPPVRYGCIPCTQVVRSAKEYSACKGSQGEENAANGRAGEARPVRAHANSSKASACQGIEKNIFQPLTRAADDGSEGKRMTDEISILSYSSEGRAKIHSSTQFVNSNAFGFTIRPAYHTSAHSVKKNAKEIVTARPAFRRSVFSVIHARALSYSTVSLNALHNCCIVSKRMKTNQRENNNTQNAARSTADERIRQESAKSKTGAGWRHTSPLLSRHLFQ